MFVNGFITKEPVGTPLLAMFPSEERTIDGNELQFSTNFHGHFLLTELLLPLLIIPLLRLLLL